MLLLVAAILAGCGLPGEYPLLEPPVLPYSGYVADNVAQFQFLNQPQTVTGQVTGFELYYKLYDPATVGYLTDVTTINNAFAPTATAPPTDVPGYLTQLGFHRVVEELPQPSSYVYGTDLSPQQLTQLNPVPLISIAPDQMLFSLSVTIDFKTAIGSNETDSFPAVTSSAPAQLLPPGIARLLQDPAKPGSYILRGFGSSDYYSSDSDVTAANIQLRANGSLQVGMIAVAYSSNVLTSPPQILYSAPLALGVITYPSTITPGT